MSPSPNYEFGEQINEFQMRNSWNPLKHCSVIQSGKGGQSWTVQIIVDNRYNGAGVMVTYRLITAAGWH